jgi:hypothetical protein
MPLATAGFRRPVSWGGCRHGPALVIAGKRAALRRRAIREIKEYLIDETPTPPFRRVVAFDDGMSSGMKMLGRVSPRRLVATPHVSARSTDPQVNPSLANLEAFFAAQSTRRYGDDPVEMRAFDLHLLALPASAYDPSCDVFLVPAPAAVMR